MGVEDGWSRLPRTLRAAFVAYALIELARLGFAVLAMAEYKHDVLSTVMSALDYGALVLAVVGTFQAARRIAGAGAAVGMQLAVASAIGGLVVHVTYLGANAVFAVHELDIETIQSVYKWITYGACAIAIVGAIGWGIAARDPLLGILLGVATLGAWLGYQMLGWVGLASDERTVATVLAITAIAHTGLSVVIAAVAAARNEQFAPPRQPSEGLGQLSAGMWLGAAAIAVLGLVILVTWKATSDHAAEVGLMIVVTIGLVGVMLFGLGATTACREPEGAPAGWLVTASSLLMFAAAGLALEQLVALFQGYMTGHDAFDDRALVRVLVLLGSAAVGAVVALAGTASYARARGEDAAAQTLTTALIAYCVLMAVGSVVLWSARDAGGSTALMRVGVAGAAGIVAGVLGARAFVRAATLFGTAPTIPEARLRR